MDSVDTSQEEQQLAIVLPGHQFHELIRGESEGEGPTIHDVADELVVDDGKAPEQYSLFWSIYTSARGLVVTERLRPDGTETKHICGSVLKESFLQLTTIRKAQ